MALLLAGLLPAFGWAAENPQKLSEPVLQLEDAVATAVRDNPSLSRMQARYEALAQIPSQVGTLPDPVLSLNAANLPTDSFALDQEPMTQMQIGISQMFPYPGKLSLREEASRYEAEAAELDVDEMRLHIIEGVRTQWWQLFFLDRALEIVSTNQDLLREFVEVARTKYEVGMGLQQDVLLAQLELSRLLDREIELHASRRNTAVRLNTLMDIPANAAVVLPGQASMQMPDIADEPALYQRAGNTRPRLQGEIQRIEAARSRLSLARRDYYPDFMLGVAYGNRQDNPAPAGGSRADLVSMKFSVSLPIHTGSRQSRAVQQRTQELAGTRDSLDDIWNGVRADISSATADYERARQQFLLFESGIIPQAQQTVASMLAGYQVSEVDFLNLVRSQVTLFRYELQYWKSLTDANKALARLVAAVGEDDIHE